MASSILHCWIFPGAEETNDIKGDPTKTIGANHFGFQVDDLAETQRRIESAGGTFFFELGDERHGNFERKFKDPDGVVFDISQNGWVGTDGRRWYSARITRSPYQQRTLARSSYPSSKVVTPNISPYGRTGGGP
jgi:Glyoxalase/Bleomycin resistance protein/Dioxygenase superfamily